jgi:DNA polymerase-1
MLYRMESRGIKIDKSLLAKMSKELGEEHAKLEKEMCQMAGYDFNIGSPAQLSEVLFTKLQLPTAGIKKGKTGFSTGQKELDKLRGQHPIIELIERTRELSKLKNTYVDTLPEQTDGESRLHTDFRQDIAATGRLSSNNPNLQNIPVRSDLGRRIREAFIPDKGNVFVSADYSQFELRLAAVLADDKQLIEDFNNDLDIHAKTASDVYDVPLDKVTKDQRRAAKVINFGIMYGMSPHGLAVAANMTFVEAKEFIDEYFKLRAPIKKYIDTTLEKADKEGYVETYFGRRRPTPDVKSSNFMVREGAKRAAANMPIQGTEADLMKMAMLDVDQKIEGLGEQILQVHDSILVECPEENAEKIANILKETMEGVYPELKVKLKVDVSTGKNWGEL